LIWQRRVNKSENWVGAVLHVKTAFLWILFWLLFAIYQIQ
jgi:hypothetical protein